MSTLAEIQSLVDEAQRKIQEQNLNIVKHDLWPKIKSAVALYTNLELRDRRELTLLIYDRLDMLGLQSDPRIERINVTSLTQMIQQRTGTMHWLPY